MRPHHMRRFFFRVPSSEILRQAPRTKKKASHMVRVVCGSCLAADISSLCGWLGRAQVCANAQARLPTSINKVLRCLWQQRCDQEGFGHDAVPVVGLGFPEAARPTGVLRRGRTAQRLRCCSAVQTVTAAGRHVQGRWQKCVAGFLLHQDGLRMHSSSLGLLWSMPCSPNHAHAHKRT